MDKVLYVLNRLLKGVVVILAIVVLNFMLIRAAPGDPASVIAGESGAADQQFVDQLREEFGLDRPILDQLVIYVGGVVTLDLGYSYRQKSQVIDLILERLPATILLTVSAFLIALAAGVLLGTIAAMRVGEWSDTLITILALGFYATPLFWFGLMAILLFSVQLNWLPALGMETIGAKNSGFSYIIDVGRHLILPSFTLGLFYMATYARLMRSSILEVSHQDFVKTAKAKGLSKSRIVTAHIMRNAVLSCDHDGRNPGWTPHWRCRPG